MSESQNFNRKKKHKSSRSKSSGSTKSKEKKLKCQPTEEYRQNEADVQTLLESACFQLDFSTQSYSGTRSAEFFFGNESNSFTTELSNSQPPALNETYTHNSTEYDDATDKTSDTFQDSDRTSNDSVIISNSAKSTSLQSSPVVNQTTASTFINIDLISERAIAKMLLEKYYFDSDMLYMPTARLNDDLKLVCDIDWNRLTPQTRRLLNRYYEEAIAAEEDISVEIISKLCSLADSNERIFVKDANRLYRTLCEHKFRPVFCEPTAQIVEIPTRKFLKLYVKEMCFTAHPLLQDEHRLANVLEDLYEQYMQRISAKLCERLQAKLNIERKIVNELLKRESQPGSETPLTAEKRLQTLEEHLRNVKSLREQLYAAETSNKKLLKKILNIWLKLKTLRKNQDQQYTRFRLRIKVQQPTDVELVCKNWNQRFETDLNEIYREELEKYYRAKRLWLKEEGNINTKPRKPNLDKITSKLKTKYRECLNAPEEPQISILRSLIDYEEFYKISPHNFKLKTYFMKIYFDEQFVGETRSYRLEPDLKLYINEVIGVFVERRLPKDIRIAIYKKTKFSTPKKVADLNVTTANLLNNINSTEMPMQNMQFSSIKAPITGHLTLHLECTEEYCNQDLFIPTKSESNINREVVGIGQNNKKCLLQKELLKAHTDRIVSISEETDAEAQDIVDKTVAKTCTFEETLLQFCDIEEIENNQRFRLLRSRYLQNDARTKDLRFVPALENELEFDWNEQKESVIDPGNWMDDIDLHKHEGKKYLKTLYSVIDNQCARLNKVMEHTENPLIGDEPAFWAGLIRTLTLIINPKRPLNPLRNSLINTSHSLPLTLDTSQNLKIILNVVRATGIPIRGRLHSADRKPSISSSSTQMFVTQNIKYANVRPFITLSHKDKVCRTLTAEGSNPTWNEQLVLTTSGNLKELRDDIKISLFDELIEQHANDDPLSLQSMDMYQRIQTNWLGEYRIPISALLVQQKFEGVFELNMPKILLGYRRPTLDNIASIVDTNIAIEQYPEIKENIHLWFYISMEPTFELPQVHTSCLECGELREVRQHLNFWSLQIKELQPKRFLEPLICNINGKRVCLTRLLEPIPMPLRESPNLINSVCRFVSLLSITKSYDSCIGFGGVWLNNELLLDTTWGSAKDLGVLLCNYFLSIGVKCWLILGLATPHGQSAFVLYRTEDGDMILVDPSTGKQYFTKDVFCPLYKINYAVTPNNIYCNMQTETRVAMTNFNFNDTSCWISAFNKKNPAPLGGVQQLNYDYRNSFSTLELRKNIERKIIKKISSWRSMRKTIWNRAFQHRLYTILLELEHESTFGTQSYNDSNLADKIFTDFPNYKIYGFTLNFAYTNLTTISDRIKTTGIHLNSDKNVEFSLAVHVHPYANNILSVWLFLISIIPL